MMMEWPTIALFWNAPRSVAAFVDPVFGKPLELLPVRSAWWQTARRLATHAGCDDLRARRPLHPHTRGTRAFARTEQKLRYIALAWPLDHVCVPVTGPLRCVRTSIDLNYCSMVIRSSRVWTYTDAHVTLTGMLIVCAALVVGAVDRGCQRRVRGSRALDCGGDSPGCAVLYLPSSSRVVRSAAYRETERAGARAVVYCAQYRTNATSVRTGRSIAT